MQFVQSVNRCTRAALAKEIPIKPYTLASVSRKYMHSRMAAQENFEVFHDKDKCEFAIQLSDSGADKAFLSYSWLNPHQIDMYHTKVPPVFRGKGVAKILAKAAFDFAVDQDAKMILSCTYLQKYFKDNPKPEYESRIA